MLKVDAQVHSGERGVAVADWPTAGKGERRWVELRDARGKLQGKWDPGAGVLEIQARGVTSWYRLRVAFD